MYYFCQQKSTPICSSAFLGLGLESGQKGICFRTRKSHALKKCALVEIFRQLGHIDHVFRRVMHVRTQIYAQAGKLVFCTLPNIPIVVHVRFRPEVRTRSVDTTGSTRQGRRPPPNPRSESLTVLLCLCRTTQAWTMQAQPVLLRRELRAAWKQRLLLHVQTRVPRTALRGP